MSEENIQTVEETTEVEVATENPIEETITTPEIDYQKKFSESSKEALRLLEETKAKDAEIERLRQLTEGNAVTTADDSELYPGFSSLSEEEQQNLINYTNGVTKKAVDNIYKDPAIAFAKRSYNEQKWNSAFNDVSAKYPTLRDDGEFKRKFFKADNVPDNIGDLLDDLAKIHLFDKAKDLGAQEAAEKLGRIEIERSAGGDKTPTTTTRSMEDWHRMAQENPAQFAKMKEEFNKDMASGKSK
jgi:hypothetical protein